MTKSASESLEIERRGLVRELGAVEFRVPSASKDVVFSPDGTMIAVAAGRLVLLLDAHSGKVLRIAALEGTNTFDRAAFTTDGVLLVAVGWSSQILLLDARSLSLVRSFDSGFRDTHAVAACPGAAHFVYTGGSQQHSVLWDLRTGRAHCELPVWEHNEDAAKANYSYIHQAVFSPDGSKLVTVSYDGADLWEIPSGTHLAHLASRDFCPSSAAFSPDGEDLYLANNVGRVALVNPRTGSIELDREVIPSRRSVHRMFVTPDGESLACCPEDGAMHVVTPSNLKLQRTVGDVGSLGVGAALSPDGDTLFINDERGAIVRVSISEGTVERPVISGPVDGLAFRDDDTIVAVHQHGALMQASLSTGALQCGRWACGWRASLSPRATRAVFSSKTHDGTSSVLDVEASKIVATCQLDGSTAINDDGLVCVATERGVLLGDSSTRVEAPSLKRYCEVYFSADGSTLFGRSNSDLTRIDVKSRTVRDVAKVSRGSGVATDASGRVVVGAGTKLILLGDESNKSDPETFVCKGATIVHVASSRDGSVVAAADSGGRLWLARRGAPRSLCSARVAHSSISRVAFSPDGTHVAVGGADTELRVYSVSALFEALGGATDAKADSKKSASDKPAAKKAPAKKSPAKKGKASK